MAKSTPKYFSVRSHDIIGAWSSDDRRHAESARHLLAEFEVIYSETIATWPIPDRGILRTPESHHPEFYQLIRKRDRLCDSVLIFSAMAVEGFLNYYGVVRLGEDQFNAHFERLGIFDKLRQLLQVCDGLLLAKDDPLVLVLEEIAHARNSLVHPKTKEYEGYVPAEERPGILLPQAPRDAVEAMDRFFRNFQAIVPAASNLLPNFPKA